MTPIDFLQIANFLLLLLLGACLLLIWRRLQRLSKLVKDSGDEALIAAFKEEGSRLEQIFRQESATTRSEAEERGKRLREEMLGIVQNFGNSLQTHIANLGESMAKNIRELLESNDRKQEDLRKTVEGRLDKLREENSRKIEEMQRTVDEKLENTLQKRLNESFKQVSDRLERVHQGLGEMQTLAIGVGDLKRTLSNVKTRGIMAEIQLETLLDEILTPEQYIKNAQVSQESRGVVEFAVRMPGQGRDEDSDVLLPIDAKFPQEDFARLMLAQEEANKEAIENALKALETRVKSEAKSISEKYIKPPHTTDFAIMFLPTEGLFAEIVRRPGLLELLHQKHRVVVAGPTTLSVLLNSLRMGFRSLAIQKRSGEVWKLLGKAKEEFKKYGDTWDTVAKQLQAVSNTVDKVGTRHRVLERTLSDVDSLEKPQSPNLIEQERQE